MNYKQATSFLKIMKLSFLAAIRNLLISSFEVFILKLEVRMIVKLRQYGDGLIKNTYRKIEIQALLSRNRRIKQTVRLPIRLFQNDSSVVLLFFWIITINFSTMSNETLGLAYDFSMNFLTLWRNSSYGHPQPLGNFHLLAPLPQVPWGGGMDIFWNCTLHHRCHYVTR